MNLKERVEKNEILLGTMISELGCPNLIRMMQTGGFQFVIIDLSLIHISEPTRH